MMGDFNSLCRCLAFRRLIGRGIFLMVFPILMSACGVADSIAGSGENPESNETQPSADTAEAVSTACLQIRNSAVADLAESGSREKLVDRLEGADCPTDLDLYPAAPIIERTTTSTSTTVALSPEEQVADAICTDIKRVLDENPDMRVAGALSYGESLRSQLGDGGWDLSSIGQLVTETCSNGYNNEVMLGYGGFGPLADRVTYTLDRGSCGSRGDYGGIVTMTGTGSAHEVSLDLRYIAEGVVEHETSERVEVEPGGNAVAFEFFMPQLPAGGTCEVTMKSVATS